MRNKMSLLNGSHLNGYLPATPALGLGTLLVLGGVGYLLYKSMKKGKR